jgi:hypothetical protein
VATNPIINGGFDIWQRGTSAAGAANATTFGPDRWNLYRGVAGSTFSRQVTNDTTNLPFIQYCVRAQRDSGNTSTADVLIGTTVETANSLAFAGKTVTLSFYARAGANFSASSNAISAQLRSGTGTDQNDISGFTNATIVIGATPFLTTTWQRFTYTGTVASTATQIGLRFLYTPVGTAGANDWFEITGVQVEVGSVATPFRRSGGTLQGELAAAQRYYQKSYDINTAPQSNNIGAGLMLGNAQSNVPNQQYFISNVFKVEMRTAPTVTIYSYTSSTAGVVSDANGVDKAANSGIASHIGTRSFNVYNNSGGTIATANGGFVGHYVASAEL